MDTSKTRIAVLYGGRSTEHEISIITALQALDAFDSTRFDAFPVYIDPDGAWWTGAALRKRSSYPLSPDLKKQCMRVQLAAEPPARLIAMPQTKGWFNRYSTKEVPVDVFFPSFHGPYGEDGCIQGLLEWIGAPYAGSGLRACSVGMNKHAAKQLLVNSDIPALPDLLIHRREWDPNNAHILAGSIQEQMHAPWMVKPCNLGSSIAISSARTVDELMISLAGAFTFDNQVMVEPLLEDMYELNVSVLYGDPPLTSAIERPKRENALLTFEDKYMRGGKKHGGASEGMASLERDINPSDVSENVLREIRRHAVQAFSELDCRGIVRFDFMVNRQNNKVYFNEVNMTPGSFSYYLWEAAESARSFTELLSTLVDQAMAEHECKRSVRRQIEMRVLN